MCDGNIVLNLCLDKLNEPQREAVVNQKYPCSIVAGPGSGKTRVITLRIAYLIRSKIVSSSNVMVLTFTNKAAKNLKEQLVSLVGQEDSNGILVGTFHSCFAKILRKECRNLGLTSSFSIYDTNDSYFLLKGIIKNLKLDVNIYNVREIFSKISYLKSNLIEDKDCLSNAELVGKAIRIKMPMFVKIYEQYTKQCITNNAVDFNDILLYTYKLFRDNKDVLEKYQSIFKYFFIDEFQDTDLLQYNIIKLLSSKTHNVCVVGDDSQSIYAFRGATVHNILDFQNDFKGTNIIKLQQNYRSTKNILGTANSVIVHNKNRLPKTLWTDNEEGPKCEISCYKDEYNEARSVVKHIININLTEDHGCKYSDIAILYRNNRQAGIFEDILSSYYRIPYKIVGDISLYQRQEIKDLVSYLRVLINPDDVGALLRSICSPRRGIGQVIICNIYDVVRDAKITFWEAITNAPKYFSLRIQGLLHKYVSVINECLEFAKNHNAYELVRHVYETSGLSELYKDKSQYVNLFLNTIEDFVNDENNLDKSLATYMEIVQLDNEIEDENNENKISLMTMHTSKGLEFKYVYIIGMTEENFPLNNESNANIEEERRLFYVAITRAKIGLYISYPMFQRTFGNVNKTNCSHLIKEIDNQFLIFNNCHDEVIKRNHISSGFNSIGIKLFFQKRNHEAVEDRQFYNHHLKYKKSFTS